VDTEPKNLIFDADDTLWQNNVYFIEATEAFLDAMEAHHLDRSVVRRELAAAEAIAVKRYGYGTEGFTTCLVETAKSLAPEISEQALEDIRALGRAISGRETLELLPGVEAALEHLSGHHRLFLLTKGEDREQRGKLERSTLGRFFCDVEVVREKDVEAYRSLIKRLQLETDHTWMIGNSPRSDINPALAAGLNAVLIPHPQTWELELEEIEHPGSKRLAIVDSFTDLIDLFISPAGPG